MATKMKSAGKSARPRSKSDIYKELSSNAGLTRKQVASIFDGLAGLIKKDISGKGPGVFSVPGLMKITVIHKPATKAREGVNPFTGEKMMFKAKPARKVVKVRPLKALKSMV